MALNKYIDRLMPSGTSGTSWQLDTANAGPLLKNDSSTLALRNAVDSLYANLKTNSITLPSAASITIGMGADPVNLYRSAANILKTDDTFICSKIGVGASPGSEFAYFDSGSATTAIARFESAGSNGAFIQLTDSGSKSWFFGIPDGEQDLVFREDTIGAPDLIRIDATNGTSRLLLLAPDGDETMLELRATGIGGVVRQYFGTDQGTKRFEMTIIPGDGSTAGVFQLQSETKTIWSLTEGGQVGYNKSAPGLDVITSAGDFVSSTGRAVHLFAGTEDSYFISEGNQPHFILADWAGTVNKRIVDITADSDLFSITLLNDDTSINTANLFSLNLSTKAAGFAGDIVMSGGAGNYFQPPLMTTTERDTMIASWGSPEKGRMWFNTNLNQWEGWDGDSIIIIG